MKGKYGHLLKDKNIKRWYENVGRGSFVTANVYLRKLGNFCEKHKIAPQQLAKLKERKIYDLLLDNVTEMEKQKYAGSYTETVLKAVRSWLSFNSIEIKGKIKIKGTRDTPSLKDERVPTQDELRKIFLAGDEKGRAACVLIAHSGVRPEVLGNYNGSDGLRVKDFLELEINSDKIEFKKIPTAVRVRTNLSKKGHDYFTFLSNEGCEYLKAYLEMRMRKGEKLTRESAVITPKIAGKEFITSINIGDAIRKAVRKAGFSWRPYVLRRYFATQLMVAESKGMIIRDYRVFWMGHEGDIEHTYTLNKSLSQDVMEEMRGSYKKAQKYLQTIETEKGEEDIKKMFKKQLLLVAGFKQEEIKDEYSELDDEEFQKLVREKLTEGMKNSGKKQKVVEVSEVENYLISGWEFVGTLPNNKAVLKLQELSRI